MFHDQVKCSSGCRVVEEVKYKDKRSDPGSRFRSPMSSTRCRTYLHLLSQTVIFQYHSLGGRTFPVQVQGVSVFQFTFVVKETIPLYSRHYSKNTPVSSPVAHQYTSDGTQHVQVVSQNVKTRPYGNLSCARDGRLCRVW